MQRTTLGRTGIDVSKICLGTMTFGSVQNTEQDGFEQMDYAVDHGIDFFDTAELYAVPPQPDTCHKTEVIVGNWMKARGNRDRIVLATKVTGGGPPLPWIRGEERRLDRANLEEALNGSLQRLQTDYIDLYQVHWPDRVTGRFGKRGYSHKPELDRTPIEETLTVLGEFVKAGKVRAIGISNETPWGTMQWLNMAEKLGLPRIATVQNAYSLLIREYEYGMSEIGLREDVGLLAYSPLAGGTLSGKYLGGRLPKGSRRDIDPRESRYRTPPAEAAVQAYIDLARKHGLNPVHMALAFVRQQPFVACPLPGATGMDQLKEVIGSAEVTLSDEIMDEINALWTAHPDPCV